MGLTIESNNYSIKLGYGGFFNLRLKVAALTADDIADYYKHLHNAPHFGEERKIFFEEYNKGIDELSIKYNGKYDSILDFLYTSDCDGKVDVDHCRAIYDVIKDYDDDVCYGYSEQSGFARFESFKLIVKDCIDNNTSMIWF